MLPRELDWPLWDLLGSSGEVAGGPTDAGVVVDNATRVSQRGAVTWWHLDDGGEFVLQVGLPLSKSRQRDPRFWGESGRPIVKIFIFAEKRHYKLIAQDLVTNKTGRAACLDLFNTPSEYLPEGDDDDTGDESYRNDDAAADEESSFVSSSSSSDDDSTVCKISGCLLSRK